MGTNILPTHIYVHFITIALLGLVGMTYQTHFDVTNGCPTSCRCYVDNMRLKTLSARCQGPGLARDLFNLPQRVTSLDYIVTSSDELDVTFSHLTLLRRLRLAWAHPVTRANIHHMGTLYQFTDPHQFTGLVRLRTLHINVPVTFIHPHVLLPMTQLETLDLSLTSGLTTDDFCRLYRGSDLRGKPLKKLLLRRMSGLTGQYGDFQLRQLYPLIKNRLRYLDISDNGVVVSYPGYVKYLPHLHTFIAQKNNYR